MEATPHTASTKGVIDEAFSQLPLWARLHILFCWAELFSTQDDDQYCAVSELIEGITALDFHHYLKMDEKKFLSLAHLPFSSHLAHLNLSESTIGRYPTLVEFISHPIFQHLTTLDLSKTRLRSLDPLLSTTPHNFPNLHTLNISKNVFLDVATPINHDKFPKLKVLDLREVGQSNTTISNLLPPPTPPPAAAASFPSSSFPSPGDSIPLDKAGQFTSNQRLEQLSMTSYPLPLQNFASPSLSQLQHLSINRSSLDQSAITFLFGADTGVLKNLTHLDLADTRLDDAALIALAQSPYLANLTTLKLYGGALSFQPYSSPTQFTSAMRAFIQSPYLWTPKLKRLELTEFPTLSSSSSSSSLEPATLLFNTLDNANVKIETFNLDRSTMDLDLFSISPCFSQLQSFSPWSFTTTTPTSSSPPPPTSVEEWDDALTRFAQSPNLSNLTNFKIPDLVRHEKWTHQQFVSLFTSPMMSNDLLQFDIDRWACSVNITDDWMETILTARVIPGDETSPLKFGKLQKLNLSRSQVGHRTIELIVQNLPYLTHLQLEECSNITDTAIAALIGHEHVDPKHPYPTLPNLTHLNLNSCPITGQGWIELSNSQLLDQLEDLNLGDDGDEDPDERADIIVKTPLFSNMKSMYLPTEPSIDKEDLGHLDNCQIDTMY